MKSVSVELLCYGNAMQQNLPRLFEYQHPRLKSVIVKFLRDWNATQYNDYSDDREPCKRDACLMWTIWACNAVVVPPERGGILRSNFY